MYDSTPSSASKILQFNKKKSQKNSEKSQNINNISKINKFYQFSLKNELKKLRLQIGQLLAGSWSVTKI